MGSQTTSLISRPTARPTKLAANGNYLSLPTRRTGRVQHFFKAYLWGQTHTPAQLEQAPPGGGVGASKCSACTGVCVCECALVLARNGATLRLA